MRRRLLLTIAIVPWVLIIFVIMLWGIFVQEDEGHYMVRPSTLAAPTWVPISATRTPLWETPVVTPNGVSTP